MTPAEVFSLLEFNRPKVVDGVHEDDRENMLRRMQELEADGIRVL